jgi:hypothetical protein
MKSKIIKPLISKEHLNKMSEEEKIRISNIHLMEFEQKPIEESKEITLKPFEKVWNEVSQKIKWVNKPKNSHPYFDYIHNELTEIYGEKMGGVVMRMNLDIMECEFHKMNGERIDWDDILYGGCSLNQWRKLITEVDKMFSKCGSKVKFQTQRVEPPK